MSLFGEGPHEGIPLVVGEAFDVDLTGRREWLRHPQRLVDRNHLDARVVVSATGRSRIRHDGMLPTQPVPVE